MAVLHLNNKPTFPDKYSDGEVELDILKYIKSAPPENYTEIFSKDHRWAVYYHLAKSRENAVNWMDIPPDSEVLEIGGGMGAVTGALCDKAKKVVSLELSEQRAEAIYRRHFDRPNLEVVVGNLNDVTSEQFEKKFDVITLIGVLEYTKSFTHSKKPYKTFLENIRRLLKPNGKLIIAIENRLGIKYWCGSPEDHTGVPFDSLRGYEHNSKIETFDKQSLANMLKKSGFSHLNFFYPCPDYKFPSVIFSDETLPTQRDVMKMRPYFNRPSLLLADELKLTSDIVKNNTFPFFANSFIVEASQMEFENNITYISFVNQRNNNYSIMTKLTKTCAQKYPLDKKAIPHLNTIAENHRQLKLRGINVLDAVLENETLTFKRIDKPTADQIFVELYLDNNLEKCREMLARLRTDIEKSSDKSNKNAFFEKKFAKPDCKINFGKIVQKGYLDMTLFNAFINDDNTFTYFDQEWVMWDAPVNYIIYRNLYNIYINNKILQTKIPRVKFFADFSITEGQFELFSKMESLFTRDIFDPLREIGLDYDSSAPDKRLSKTLNNMKEQIERSNIDISALKNEVSEKESHITELNADNQNLRDNLDDYKTCLHNLDEKFLLENRQHRLEVRELITTQNDLRNELENVRSQYTAVINSTMWKSTKPARVMLDFTKKIFRPKNTVLLAKGIKSIFTIGPSATIRKMKQRKQRLNEASSVRSTLIPTRTELLSECSVKFPKQIKFSILTPLYNTDPTFLKEMVESVVNQTYTNWELCLADGSDSKHSHVEKYCREISQLDNRILYKKISKNEGISGNTNQCIEMATGDYVALLDHDDLLHPSALHHYMQAICTQNADYIYCDELTFVGNLDKITVVHHKPDFAIDTLRSCNYICHFSAFRKSLLDKVGGYRSCCDGSQDYDMTLRITEHCKSIVHIPKLLYFWRAHENSVAQDISSKPYVIEAAKLALSDHLKRCGLEGKIENSRVPSTYKINYKIIGNPKVTIIIPNKDHMLDLKKCVDSVLTKSTYKNFEIIIIENNSTETSTFDYYELLKQHHNIKILTWNGPFNYSAINNFGVKNSDGDYLILLNNDTEVITQDWIEQMLMHAQRKDVGIVGAKLYYPDNTVQHGGVILGMGGVAGHLFLNSSRDEVGYMGRLSFTQNLSAVTAACCMLRREVFTQVGMLDEKFAVAFNDIDLCMKIQNENYLTVWTPYAELYHYESKSRGIENTPEKQKRFQNEIELFKRKWNCQLTKGDPYFNPNFRLDKNDYVIK